MLKENIQTILPMQLHNFWYHIRNVISIEWKSSFYLIFEKRDMASKKGIIMMKWKKNNIKNDNYDEQRYEERYIERGFAWVYIWEGLVQLSVFLLKSNAVNISFICINCWISMTSFGFP